jgi:diguanylate cyclase
LRLTQRDADRLREQFDIAIGLGTPADAEESLSYARRQIDEFASIVEATRVEAQAYGADLARGAAELGSYITRRSCRWRGSPAKCWSAPAPASPARRGAPRGPGAARTPRRGRGRGAPRPPHQLPNRRAFEDRLAQLIRAEAAPRSPSATSTSFKTINDSHGHASATGCCAWSARCSAPIAAALVARIGGEEFVILFEDVDPTAAGALLDRAREELCRPKLPRARHRRSIGRISFSAGVASCADGTEPPLKRADDLLYRAKNSGRNRVVVEVN